MRRGEESSGRRYLRVPATVWGLLWRLPTLCLVAAFLPACGTGTSGRGGESDEPAYLITTRSQAESGYSTEIVGLDGKHVGSRREFTLQPGRHTVYVEGTWEKGMGGAVAAGVGALLLAAPIVAAGVAAGVAVAAGRGAEHSDRLRACFIARPGRTYEARTYAEGGVWKVEVVDQTTTFDVKSPCIEVFEAPLVLTGGPKQPPDPFDR
jgi:hypothetical protein